MSLKDLLPEGTFEEITASLSGSAEALPKARCPTCGRSVPYSLDSPFRPFCSERCKLLDLGAWASEERVIPGEPLLQDEDAGESASHLPDAPGDTPERNSW